jgi:hypothetical protein
MEPAECREACEYLVEQARGIRRPLDMRLLINSFKDFIDWREYRRGCHRPGHVDTRLKERPIGLDVAAVKRFAGRAAEKREHLRIVAELETTVAEPQDRVQAFFSRTGESRPGHTAGSVNGNPSHDSAPNSWLPGLHTAHQMRK